MAKTFIKLTWTNEVTEVSAENLNRIENGVLDAITQGNENEERIEELESKYKSVEELKAELKYEIENTIGKILDKGIPQEEVDEAIERKIDTNRFGKVLTIVDPDTYQIKIYGGAENAKTVIGNLYGSNEGKVLLEATNEILINGKTTISKEIEFQGTVYFKKSGVKYDFLAPIKISLYENLDGEITWSEAEIAKAMALLEGQSGALAYLYFVHEGNSYPSYDYYYLENFYERSNSHMVFKNHSGKTIDVYKNPGPGQVIINQ